MLALCMFPEGSDGETDVMVLVERKEALDALVNVLLTWLDIRVYFKLNEFLEFSERKFRFLRQQQFLIK